MKNVIDKRFINASAILSIVIPMLFIILIGVMFIISASGVLDSHYSWNTVNARVTQIDTAKNIMTLHYVFNGETYNVETELVNGAYMNQVITIKLNPTNPKDIYIWVIAGNPIITLFTVMGGFLIGIPSSVAIIRILLLVGKNNKVKNISEELHLDYQPSFLFEYKPMNNQEAKIYHFTPSEGNVHNYSVIDDAGKEHFGTECLSKFNLFGKTYQLIDYNNRQTVIVKLSRGSNKNDPTQIPVKVNNKNFVDYFLERHLNFDTRFDEKRKVNVYTIYNGSNKLGEIYDEPGYRNVYMINTMKENIDDIALFLLCLSYNSNN